MAEISIAITVPDAKLSAVVNALAYQNGYTDMVEDDDGSEPVPNPQTKAQFIKAHFLSIARATYKAHNDGLAVASALNNQDEDGSDFS